MGVKIRKYSLVIFLISIFAFLPTSHYTKAINEVNILCFIEDFFGDSYYITKGILENYNYTIMTASSNSFVQGCKNPGKNVTDTYADILLTSITDDDVKDYDCILIPSGGHWNNVINHPRIIQIIKLAAEEGILLAGICTGMMVLAFAGVLDGVNIAKNYFARDWLRIYGANMTDEDVVFDQGIITAAWGGGLGLGPEAAPHDEFCSKIKEVLETPSNAVTISPVIYIIMTSIGLVIILLFRRLKN